MIWTYNIFRKIRSQIYYLHFYILSNNLRIILFLDINGNINFEQLNSF